MIVELNVKHLTQFDPIWMDVEMPDMKGVGVFGTYAAQGCVEIVDAMVASYLTGKQRRPSQKYDLWNDKIIAKASSHNLAYSKIDQQLTFNNIAKAIDNGEVVDIGFFFTGKADYGYTAEYFSPKYNVGGEDTELEWSRHQVLASGYLMVDGKIVDIILQDPAERDHNKTVYLSYYLATHKNRYGNDVSFGSWDGITAYKKPALLGL